MLDIRLIRERPEWVRQQLARLHDDDALARLDRVIVLDARRRMALSEAEKLQAQRNRLNRTSGHLRNHSVHDPKMHDPETAARCALAARAAILAGDYDGAEAALRGEGVAATAAGKNFVVAFAELNAALREMGERYHDLHQHAQQANEELRAEMLWLPNLPHESVPDSAHEVDNIPGPARGQQRDFAFAPLQHWDIGPRLGIIDFERGVRMMGSRGYILRGAGALLQRALIAYLLDRAHADGFVEHYLPVLMREEMLEGSAQFPKFRDVVYEDPDAGLFLLPTAEVALTNFYRDEILEEEQLPIRFVAHSPCFRRERMSAGRDVRGIKRVHQFEKVERYSFTHPDTSYDELEALTVAAEGICADLGLPYRRLEIVTGDLGFSASKKYDVEVWAPGSEEWLEVSSCSNTEDFQARRANIRFRPRGAKRTRFPHTLNGSALALPRTIIAILENYQQADGSVRIPEAITQYFGGHEMIAAPE